MKTKKRHCAGSLLDFQERCASFFSKKCKRYTARFLNFKGTVCAVNHASCTIGVISFGKVNLHMGTKQRPQNGDS